MNRSLTAIFAALEAALVVAIGIGISLAPLTIVWAVQYGFAVDWTAFWRASVDIWLVGHGVDLHVSIDPSFTVASALSGSPITFALTIGALGFALVTVLLGVRAGRRIGETRFRVLGIWVAILSFGALSLLVTLSSLNPAARASILQGSFLPTLVFAIGLTIGVIRTQRAAGDDAGSSIGDWIADWPTALRAAIRQALVGGAAAVSGVLAIAALAVAVMLVANFARVIGLYEQLHGGPLGGFVLTLGQLAVLPNLVIWAAAWLIGPGFAIGTGSTVAPLATTLGPLPALPILGALPNGQFAFGFLGLLVPVVVGFLIGAVSKPALVREVGPTNAPRWFVVAGLGNGLVGGIMLGLLSWWSAGSAGPGRLADVGPNPITVAAFAALEIGLSATVGYFTSRPERAKRVQSSPR
jgi:Family of unknown function (DUF6350)